MASKKTIKSVFESLMFVWGEPLDAKIAAELMDINKNDAIEYFRELQDEYEQEGRGVIVREINGGFQFVSRADNAEYIERLCTPVKHRRLTQSALEALAIIAYRQPVTRGEIESIRGIKCDRIIEGLLKKELIEEAGRSNGIGRPILYGTTDTFLRYFGFKNLNDLPDIEDIENVIHEDEAPDELELHQISLDFDE